MESIKKLIEITIDVKGSLGELFTNLSKNFGNSVQSIENIKNSIQGIKEHTESASTHIGTLISSLERLVMPPDFDKILANFTKLGSIRVPNLDGFTNGLSALAKMSIPDPDRVQKIANALKPLDGMTAPNMEPFARGLKVFKEIDDEAIIMASQALSLLSQEFKTFPKNVVLPDLHNFAQGIQILSGLKLQGMGLKLRALADGLSHFTPQVKIPQLKQFAEGISLLAETTVSAKVTKLPLKFATLANSLRLFEGIKVPQLGQFASGVQKLTEVNTAKISAVATRLEILQGTLAGFNNVKVPQLSQFAKGINTLAAVDDNNMGIVIKNLEAMHGTLAKYSGLKMPQFGQLAKGIAELSKVTNVEQVAKDLGLLAPVLLKLDGIKTPDFKPLAKGVKILSDLKLDTDFSGKLTVIGEALKKFPQTAVTFPDMTGFAKGIAELNATKLEGDIATKLSIVGTALREFPEQIKVPNLTGLADGLRVLNNVEIKPDFSKKITDLATDLAKFTEIRVPSLKGLADGVRVLGSVDIPDKLSGNLTKIRVALEGFTKDIKVPNLKPFAEGLIALSAVKTFPPELPEIFRKLALALKEFSDLKAVPNIGSLVKGLQELVKLDMDQVAGQFARLSKSLGELERAGKLHVFTRMAQDLKMVSALTTDANQKVATGRTLIAKYGYAAASATSSLSKFNSKVYGLARGLSAINARLGSMTGFTATFASVFAVKGAVKVLADYDDSLRAAGATAQASADQMKQLEDITRLLGATTRYTSGEVAEALRQLSMAGFSVEESIVALPQVLKLATAGMMDIGRAADITTNILRGYAMDVDQLGRINDVLVAAFTNSSTNLEQLGTAFQYVGPLAAAANMEFEETAALLAGLAQSGYVSSKAGMSLRNAITRLLEPTKAVAAALDSLGINTLDANGNLLSMIDIIEEFRIAGATVGDIVTIFGKRAGPGIAALINQPTESLRNFKKTMDESAGTADQVARDMEAGLGGALRELNSAWEELTLEFGRQIEPVVLEFLQQLTNSLRQNKAIIAEWGKSMLDVGFTVVKAIRSFGLWVAANKELVRTLIGIAVSSLILVKALKGAWGLFDIVTALGATGVAAKELVAKLGTLGKTVVLLRNLFIRASVAVGTFGAVVSAITGVGVAVALVAGGVAIWNSVWKDNAKNQLDNAKKALETNREINIQVDTLKKLHKVFTTGTEGTKEWSNAERELAQVLPMANTELDAQGELVAKVGKAYKENLPFLEETLKLKQADAAYAAKAALIQLSGAYAKNKQDLNESVNAVDQLRDATERLSTSVRESAGEQLALDAAFAAGIGITATETEIQSIESLRIATAKATENRNKLLEAKSAELKVTKEAVTELVKEGKSLEEIDNILTGAKAPKEFIKVVHDMYFSLIDGAKKAEEESLGVRNAILDQWRKDMFLDNSRFFDQDGVRDSGKKALSELQGYNEAVEAASKYAQTVSFVNREALVADQDAIIQKYKDRMDAINDLKQYDPGYTKDKEIADSTAAEEEKVRGLQELNKRVREEANKAIKDEASLKEKSEMHLSKLAHDNLIARSTTFSKAQDDLNTKMEKGHISELGFIQAKAQLELQYENELASIRATGGVPVDDAIKFDTSIIEEEKARYEEMYAELNDMTNKDGEIFAAAEQLKLAKATEFAKKVLELRTATSDRLHLEYADDVNKWKAADAEKLKALHAFNLANAAEKKALKAYNEEVSKAIVKSVEDEVAEINAIRSEAVQHQIAGIKEVEAATYEVELNTNKLIADLKAQQLQDELDKAEEALDILINNENVKADAITKKEQEVADLRLKLREANTTAVIEANKLIIASNAKAADVAMRAWKTADDAIVNSANKRSALLAQKAAQGNYTPEQASHLQSNIEIEKLDAQIVEKQAYLTELQSKLVQNPDADSQLEQAEMIKGVQDELLDLQIQYTEQLTQEIQLNEADRLKGTKQFYDDQKNIIDDAYSSQQQQMKQNEAADVFGKQFKEQYEQKRLYTQQFYRDSISALESHNRDLAAKGNLYVEDIRANNRTIVELNQQLNNTLADLQIEYNEKVRENQSKVENERMEQLRSDSAERIRMLQNELLQTSKQPIGSERAQQELEINKRIYAETEALRLQEIASVQKAYNEERATIVDLINVKNEYYDTVAANRQASLEDERNVANATLDILGESWRQSAESVKEYTNAVDAAFKLGLMTAKDHADALILASDSMLDGLALGITNSFDQIRTNAELMAEVGMNVADYLTDGFTAMFDAWMDGTKSAKEAFKEFARGVVQEIAKMILKQMILNALQSAMGYFSDGGPVTPSNSKPGTFGDAVTVNSLADGGRVVGFSPTRVADNIPAWLTAREFVQPVKAVDHYGTAFMESIRTLKFPKELINGFKFPKASSIPRSHRLAGGGMVAPAGDTIVKSGDTKLKVVNVIDKGMIGDYMGASEGERIIMNVIRRNGSTIRAMSGR